MNKPIQRIEGASIRKNCEIQGNRVVKNVYAAEGGDSSTETTKHN